MEPRQVDLDLPDGAARLWARAWPEPEAHELFGELRATIDWHQEEIRMYGRPVRVPRLVAWHGDPEAVYTYSGTEHLPRPWTPALERVRRRVEALTGHAFNAVLLNLYRDGRDGMGWHADDEPELGLEPVVASASFGATRRFCLRHRRRRELKLDVPLGHGSLLLMYGATQRHWLHAVPKTRQAVGPRVNLTFRSVRPAVLRDR
ncbi:MAG: alpha-ketoglutarate-dependent dioxygenase AlkB [Lysobacterales bacterium]|nr:MAG: alpha-ketoglutarate-dependent dioxygenase AlkB [Xanthomonadales bacterium]